MKILIALTLLAAGVAQATVPLQQPTFHQVDPVPYCTNGSTLVPASSTGIDGGYLVGTAKVENFMCRPRIGYVHFYSACADVVWDLNGAIVSVTPTASNTRSTIVCPGTPGAAPLLRGPLTVTGRDGHVILDLPEGVTIDGDYAYLSEDGVILGYSYGDPTIRNK